MLRNLTARLQTLFVLIGLVFAVSTSLRVAKPIRTLADAAKRIGKGDLDLELNIDSGGRETRELGASFNQMIVGLKERDFVIPEDVIEISVPVLSHRLILSAEARIENKSAESVIHQIIQGCRIPSGLT